MADITNIGNQFETLFSSKLAPIHSQLTQVEVKIANLKSPVVRPIASKSQPFEVIPKIPKAFETMFVQVLQNIIKGSRFYKKKYERAEEQYLKTRMTSYHSVLDTIDCFDQIIKQRQPLNSTAVALKIQFLTEENQKVQQVLEIVEERVNCVLQNLQQSITEIQYEMLQKMYSKQKTKQKTLDFNKILPKLLEYQFMDFLALNPTEQEIQKYVADWKREIFSPLEIDTEYE